MILRKNCAIHSKNYYTNKLFVNIFLHKLVKIKLKLIYIKKYIVKIIKINKIHI